MSKATRSNMLASIRTKSFKERARIKSIAAEAPSALAEAEGRNLSAIVMVLIESYTQTGKAEKSRNETPAQVRG